MIERELKVVYRFGKGRRRLTLRAACMDAAREMARSISRRSGDPIDVVLDVKRGQIRRVARILEHRFRRTRPTSEEA